MPKVRYSSDRKRPTASASRESKRSTSRAVKHIRRLKQAGKPIDGYCGLLALPKEIRLLVWEALIEDEPFDLIGSVARRTVWPKQAAITRVCSLTRTETLPLFYARTTFEFNIMTYRTFECLKVVVKEGLPASINLAKIRKLNVNGYAHGGQVRICFDLHQASILDARWHRYQNMANREPASEHYHLRSNIMPFIVLMDMIRRCRLQHGCTCSAAEAIIDMLPAVFLIPQYRLDKSRANGPRRLAADSSEACDCSDLVGVDVPE